MKRYLVAIICLGFPLLAFAQGSALVKSPVPEGPLLARAADFAEWELTRIGVPVRDSRVPGTGLSTDGSATGKANPRVRKSSITVTKTGDIRHIVSIDEFGNMESRWCKGEVQMVEVPGAADPLLYTHAPTQRFENTSYVDTKNDFPDMMWISKDNYKGVVQFHGRSYMVFSDKVETLSKDELGDLEETSKGGSQKFDRKFFTASASAYIDAETRLPVKMQKGSEIYTYRFGLPPGEILKLPPKLDQALKREEARLRSLRRGPPQS